MKPYWLALCPQDAQSAAGHDAKAGVYASPLVLALTSAFTGSHALDAQQRRQALRPGPIRWQRWLGGVCNLRLG